MLTQAAHGFSPDPSTYRQGGLERTTQKGLSLGVRGKGVPLILIQAGHEIEYLSLG